MGYENTYRRVSKNTLNDALSKMNKEPQNSTCFTSGPLMELEVIESYQKDKFAQVLILLLNLDLY